MADIRKDQERDELHRAIWAIADGLRGSVDGWDFKSLPLSGSIYPELDNFGLFRPDKMRKLRQIPKLSNFNRHQKTAFIFLLIPPFSPCFAMVFCNLEGCWRDGKTHPSGFDLIQQKHYISFPRC